MRQVLRILGNRYGVSLVLAVVVIGVVLIARTFAGSGSRTPSSELGPQPETSIPSARPTTGDDGITGPSSSPGAGPTGSPSPTPVETPSLVPGAEDALTVAGHFAAAWINHKGVTAEAWRKGVTKFATKTLADKLAKVDPGSVPADRITGEPVPGLRNAGLAEVAFPLDLGKLQLRLVTQNGRWLVDTVDWERP